MAARNRHEVHDPRTSEPLLQLTGIGGVDIGGGRGPHDVPFRSQHADGQPRHQHPGLFGQVIRDREKRLLHMRHDAGPQWRRRYEPRAVRVIEGQPHPLPAELVRRQVAGEPVPRVAFQHGALRTRGVEPDGRGCAHAHAVDRHLGQPRFALAIRLERIGYRHRGAYRALHHGMDRTVAHADRHRVLPDDGVRAPGGYACGQCGAAYHRRHPHRGTRRPPTPAHDRDPRAHARRRAERPGRQHPADTDVRPPTIGGRFHHGGEQPPGAQSGRPDRQRHRQHPPIAAALLPPSASVRPHHRTTT